MGCRPATVSVTAADSRRNVVASFSDENPANGGKLPVNFPATAGSIRGNEIGNPAEHSTESSPPIQWTTGRSAGGNAAALPTDNRRNFTGGRIRR